MLDRYVAASERYDMDELVSLLAKGRHVLHAALRTLASGSGGCTSLDVGNGFGVPGLAIGRNRWCGSPAFAQYPPNPEGGYEAWSLIVLELSGDQIVGVNTFLDTETLLPRFDLPMALPAYIL